MVEIIVSEYGAKKKKKMNEVNLLLTKCNFSVVEIRLFDKAFYDVLL